MDSSIFIHFLRFCVQSIISGIKWFNNDIIIVKYIFIYPCTKYILSTLQNFYFFLFVLQRSIDPHMVLSLFIPGLIFESAFNTNYHIFLKESQQAAMLAGPGVLVNALLIGGVMHYFAHSISLFSDIDDDGYDWSWSFSIMFGAIVSATDPVAVVALLKELGASKRLSTLIEAESLLNDGTAFVMFTVLKEFASSEDGIYLFLYQIF